MRVCLRTGPVLRVRAAGGARFACAGQPAGAASRGRALTAAARLKAAWQRGRWAGARAIRALRGVRVEGVPCKDGGGSGRRACSGLA